MREDGSVWTQPDAGSDALAHSCADPDAHACPDLDAHAVSDLDAHAEVRRSRSTAMHTGMREDGSVWTQPDAGSDALSHSLSHTHALALLHTHSVADVLSHSSADAEVRWSIRYHTTVRDPLAWYVGMF
jgi:hypothetical protein